MKLTASLLHCMGLARAARALAAARERDLRPHVVAVGALAAGTTRASALAALGNVLVAIVAVGKVDCPIQVRGRVEGAVVSSAAVLALDGDVVVRAVVDGHHFLVAVDRTRIQVVVALMLKATVVVQLHVNVVVPDDEVFAPMRVLEASVAVIGLARLHTDLAPVVLHLLGYVERLLVKPVPG